MAPGLYSVQILAIALLLVSTTSASDPGLNRADSFGYVDPNGPAKWGSLSPKFTECSKGKHQAPVDIVKDEVVHKKSLKPLIRDYSPVNATMINNGFNIEIKFEGHVGVLVANGKNFTLMQAHWHTPSEHRINGVQFPGEMHLVHRAADGNLSVVSVLYQYGAPDSFLTKIKRSLDELGKEQCAEHEESHIPLGIIDTKHMRRKSRKYYRYVGSFTTPPCTENILWNILGKVRSISKEQIQALKAPLISSCKDNSRPIQPLNGRKIELYDELARTTN
ncbi:alpha carbonic anhydrase 1, chloroplastic [Alnus glutinosa]|uniref:alpha carbonic anhydrase 1, chloroplastic n=1 Tax=Alnus glutinosa TaxID=3517 RepID=UPI002D77F5BF|nr:alpha carbonic anhydrase 1, chloroplastic [Alnus glutinosa]